jgi:hypothetical protein
MEYFVKQHSIVREIWGKSDTILFIFAGAAAEFALNKAVDWLYFTGRLPKDPLGRLFSTVNYARIIVFAEQATALRAIDSMRSIHDAVEKQRNASIPDWAYRDVLYMLIHYSIASFDRLERKLTEAEKEEVFDVFYRVGVRMGLKNLPPTYTEWTVSRQLHLEQDLQYSAYTQDLFRQYRKHLGPVRYMLLKQAQSLVVPSLVKRSLKLPPAILLSVALPFYQLCKKLHLDGFMKNLILPPNYKKQIKALDFKSLSVVAAG